MKLIPLISAVIATLLVFETYDARFNRRTGSKTIPTDLPLYYFLLHKWGFDTVYNEWLNRPLMEGAYNIVFGLIDKGLLEFAGPTGAAQQTIRVGRVLASIQTGRAYDYAGFMLGALTCAFLFLNFYELANQATTHLPRQLHSSFYTSC
jgi:NADH:ubiquinone oxidoreductase subunit 5 (subunit L)/multisubunit Na+/H+ antiporter MnhA subunit